MAIGDAVYFREDRDTLVALDASSGAVRWRFCSPDEAPDAVMASEDTVYVNTFSALHALNMMDGTERWRLMYEGSPGGKYGAVTELTGDTVFVSNYAGDYHHEHDEDARRRTLTLYAVDTGTGRLKWKVSGYRGWFHWVQASESRVHIVTEDMVIALQEHDLAESLNQTQTPHFHLVDNELVRLA